MRRGRKTRTRRSVISFAEGRFVALLGVFLGLGYSQISSGPQARDAAWDGSTAQAAVFGLCDDGGGADCVIDGDTFRFGGEKIRIADIDTPETHPPRCDHEARLGTRATYRTQALLNAGPFVLEPVDRDEDRYGRKLRVVKRDGESLGETLISEGLARPWEVARRPWC